MVVIGMKAEMWDVMAMAAIELMVIVGSSAKNRTHRHVNRSKRIVQL
jgi:hypothetical protein